MGKRIVTAMMLLELANLHAMETEYVRTIDLDQHKPVTISLTQQGAQNRQFYEIEIECYGDPSVAGGVWRKKEQIRYDAHNSFAITLKKQGNVITITRARTNPENIKRNIIDFSKRISSQEKLRCRDGLIRIVLREGEDRQLQQWHNAFESGNLQLDPPGILQEADISDILHEKGVMRREHLRGHPTQCPAPSSSVGTSSSAGGSTVSSLSDTTASLESFPDEGSEEQVFAPQPPRHPAPAHHGRRREAPAPAPSGTGFVRRDPRPGAGAGMGAAARRRAHTPAHAIPAACPAPPASIHSRPAHQQPLGIGAGASAGALGNPYPGLGGGIGRHHVQPHRRGGLGVAAEALRHRSHPGAVRAIGAGLDVLGRVCPRLSQEQRGSAAAQRIDARRQEQQQDDAYWRGRRDQERQQHEQQERGRRGGRR